MRKKMFQRELSVAFLLFFFVVFAQPYLPTHCPPKSQRSTPLAAGISVDTVRPPTRSARHSRSDLVRAIPLFSYFTTKMPSMILPFRLKIAFNHGLHRFTNLFLPLSVFSTWHSFFWANEQHSVQIVRHQQ